MQGLVTSERWNWSQIMTHHTILLPMAGASLEASSQPAARGNTVAVPRGRTTSARTAQTRLAVSLAIALRFRPAQARALATTPAAPADA
jgi:hypothetical protein